MHEWCVHAKIIGPCQSGWGIQFPGVHNGDENTALHCCIQGDLLFLENGLNVA